MATRWSGWLWLACAGIILFLSFDLKVTEASILTRKLRDVPSIRFPQSTSVVEGESVVLICEANDRRAKLSWRRADRPVKSGRNGIILMTSRTPEHVRSVLRINSADVRVHKREYTCNVELEGGIIHEGKADVTVYNTDRVPSSMPVFVAQPSSTSLPVGASAVFPCAATSDGRPVGQKAYSWFVDALFEVSNSDAFQEGRLEIGSEGFLTISSAKLTDSGTYECVVTTENGMIFSNPALLTVTDAGEQTRCTDRKGQEVDPGETYYADESDPCVTCICGVDGQPTLCNSIICDAPPCRNYRLIPDTCCGFECLEPEGTCRDRKNNTVRKGERFFPKQDPCVECVCQGRGDMEDVCTSVLCAKPTCDNFIISTEVCCDYTCIEPGILRENEGTKCTDRKGQEVSLGETFHSDPSDPCVTCVCGENGQATLCNSIICDAPSCRYHRLIPDTCCGFECLEPDTCRDRNNNTIERGQTYTPGEDPCTQCTCKAGSDSQDVCLASYCQRPPCDNYEISTEVCCEYTCLDAGPLTIKETTCIDRKGVEVALGEVYHPDVSDPCVTCICEENGPTVCSTVICDAPPCDKYRLTKDTCCGFECLEPETCLDRNNQTIRKGEIYVPGSDPCEICRCKDQGPSHDSCVAMLCQLPICENLVVSTDVCCEFTCLDPEPLRKASELTEHLDFAAVPATCIDRNGRSVQLSEFYHPEGNDSCLTCVCGSDGQPTLCSSVICEAPPCRNYRLIPDTCCGFECLEPGVCTDRNGDPFKKGEVYLPREDPCTKCVCNGQEPDEICVAVQCARPPCDKFVMSTEVCCEYTCIEPADLTEKESKTCTDRKGQEVDPGETYYADQSDPCVTCVCGDDGQPISCSSFNCDAPPCRNYRLIPDTCCGFECPDETEPGCTDRHNQSVAIGDRFFPNDDPCVQCICTAENSPEANCMSVQCDRPTCDHYEWSTEVCCEYVCLTVGPPGPTELVRLDVRQVGKDAALVQWIPPEGAAIDDIQGYDVFFSDGFEDRLHPWDRVSVTSGNSWALLESLNPNKRYRVRLVAERRSGQLQYSSNVIDFALDGRVSGKFIKVDPSEMTSDVYINGKLVRGITFLNLDGIKQIQVSRDNCQFTEVEGCFSLRIEGDIFLIELEDKQDFKWLTMHF